MATEKSIENNYNQSLMINLSPTSMEKQSMRSLNHVIKITAEQLTMNNSDWL